MSAAIYAEIVWDGLVFLGCCFVALYLFREFYYKTRIMAVRYKLFALRDKLAELAVENKVSQQNTAYLALRDALNASLHVCEHLTFQTLLRVVSQYSEDEQRLHTKIKGEIGRSNDMAEIYVAFLEVLRECFRLNGVPSFMMKEPVNQVGNTRCTSGNGSQSSRNHSRTEAYSAASKRTRFRSARQVLQFATAILAVLTAVQIVTARLSDVQTACMTRAH